MTEGTPVLCIVGSSGSGKTTLMEGLIRELSERGYRVATIKHTHHKVESDQPGKDSWRHRKAGAVVSILSSPWAVGVFSEVERELTVEELRSQFIHGADLVLVEGYKSGDYPKIVVVGNNGWDGTLLSGVRAVVSDHRLDVDVPLFEPSNINGLCEFIEYEFLGTGVFEVTVQMYDGTEIAL